MTTIEFKNHIVSLEDQLRIYAYRLTTNRDDALDLCQDTVLKAITYRSKFTHTNLKAWMFTIMKNLFINAYRKNKKQREWISHETNRNMGLMNVSHDNPHSTHNYNDILKELSKLDDQLKTPFKLFLSGFKYREIAEQTGLPIGTVKSRIFQGRKVLSERLKDFAH
ncbi:sigma-70 family RNA polymerase sigma factor [Marinifilum sp. N1E240]|uniref:RNA polymerase sigma factor n=1 Tax=Marinifilum sp. N1E240 TaxID=2608082 RepID=UPI00128C4700|nr:RNA polymerase sigma factor [Marinifilum sp. N1E240]MPQ47058.1 sigma-70 family RNA polymerase sigma factor [Marinifilum sp. N1E240]